MKLAQALESFKNGNFLILTDHHDRENEGDLVIAASHITPEKVNFMTKFGRGLICVTLEPTRIESLQLAMQPRRQNNDISCAFATSVDAAGLKTSGISAADRAQTIQILANPDSEVSDLATPGHIFPVRANPGGLKQRHGHTEASLELCYRTNLFPASVICEVLDENGAAALTPYLDELSLKFAIPKISIAELLATMPA